MAEIRYSTQGVFDSYKFNKKGVLGCHGQTKCRESGKQDVQNHLLVTLFKACYMLAYISSGWWDHGSFIYDHNSDDEMDVKWEIFVWWFLIYSIYSYTTTNTVWGLGNWKLTSEHTAATVGLLWSIRGHRSQDYERNELEESKFPCVLVVAFIGVTWSRLLGCKGVNLAVSPQSAF